MRYFLCLLAAIGLVACGPDAPKFKATDVTGTDWGQQLALKDASGKPRTLVDFKGKAIFLFFGYTQCPDVCPSTLTTAAAALKLLGQDAERVQVLFVSLDPARDTPEVLGQYAPAFHPSFIGLTGSEAEVAEVAKNFKVFYQKQPGKTASAYTIDHSAGTYAYDPQGHLRLFIRHGAPAEEIAADLKLLLGSK